MLLLHWKQLSDVAILLTYATSYLLSFPCFAHSSHLMWRGSMIFTPNKPRQHFINCIRYFPIISFSLSKAGQLLNFADFHSQLNEW